MFPVTSPKPGGRRGGRSLRRVRAQSALAAVLWVTVLCGSATRGQVEGDEFAAALFGIWLGPDPLDDNLKELLLGG
jgi:hypothetical protein